MDITTRTIKTYGNEDQRWIAPGGQRALRDMDSITLDRSVFDLVTNFPNGVLPSGIVLGKITATGLYAPYDDTADGDPLPAGLEVAVGFLGVAVPLDRNSASTADLVAALYWHGEVVESRLPTHHGLDAAAKTDLAAKFRFV